MSENEMRINPGSYFRIVLLFVIFGISTSNAQKYKVVYHSLPDTLLSGSQPNICLLEDTSSNNKFYDELINYKDLFTRYEIYSTKFLVANRNILGNDFNPDSIDFIKSLRENLGIDYVLKWTEIKDQAGGYLLTVYNTLNDARIYEKEIFKTINSNPALDVEKLLIENLEPVYSKVNGLLKVEVLPFDAEIRLYKNKKLIKNLTGDEEKIELSPGKYTLISEARGYKTDKREIEVSGAELTKIAVKLKQNYILKETFIASHKPLGYNLFPGENIILGVLEKADSSNSLVKILSRPEFSNKFAVYRLNKLIPVNNTFKASDKNLLLNLRDKYQIKYLLYWKKLSKNSYHLDVLSTQNFNKTFSGIFYNSVNSVLSNDVDKLLNSNLITDYKPVLEPFAYSPSVVGLSGEIKQQVKNGFAYQIVLKSPYGDRTENPFGNLELEDDGHVLKFYYDLVSGHISGNYINLNIIDLSGNKKFRLKEISGDLNNIKPGKNKIISWDYTKEFHDLEQNYGNNNNSLRNYKIDLSLNSAYDMMLIPIHK